MMGGDSCMRVATAMAILTSHSPSDGRRLAGGNFQFADSFISFLSTHGGLSVEFQWMKMAVNDDHWGYSRHEVGICTRHSPPVILSDSMGDTVALLGQDVDLTCKVDNLGRHMVAFVRASTPPRLISFDEKIFRQKDKYELKSKMGPLNNEWVLTIKNVQEDDRGNYSCQVNADPVLTATAELDIKVPPAVSRGTPSAVEVREGHNVTLTCKAEGNPTPTVVWRRQDKQIIRYNGATGFGASVFHGPSLHLTKVNRKHMSEYVCVASNGIPPDETWTVKLLVTFAPLIQAKSTSVRVPLGGLARLVCTAESWPRPDVTWDKEEQQIFDSDNYATSQTVSGQYHSVHVLEIRRVEKHHYGSYRCTARNDNGIHFADIHLEEAEPNYLYTNAIHEGSGLVTESDDEDSDKETAGEVIVHDSAYAHALVTQPVRSISASIRTRTTPRSAEGTCFNSVVTVCDHCVAVASHVY
ncbi:immunoglobulin domain protein [Teladorsagia circumcincta]|uniref:Immunoglobulin domain protein n=1 Tax=Teladorsagia circumcincta TaxID=45464 RepID=A0A2G9V565_TELCI|nr:immunoglobulin domain protein [Teladorsagia circumcincta]